MKPENLLKPAKDGYSKRDKFVYSLNCKVEPAETDSAMAFG
jgi:hypothetical protein